MALMSSSRSPFRSEVVLFFCWIRTLSIEADRASSSTHTCAMHHEPCMHVQRTAQSLAKKAAHGHWCTFTDLYHTVKYQIKKTKGVYVRRHFCLRNRRPCRSRASSECCPAPSYIYVAHNFISVTNISNMYGICTE